MTKVTVSKEVKSLIPNERIENFLTVVCCKLNNNFLNFHINLLFLSFFIKSVLIY